MYTLTITTVVLSYSDKCFTNKYMLVVLSGVIEKILTEDDVKAKQKPRESVFRCNGPMVALKLCEKIAVTDITTIHETTEDVVKKEHAGETVIKAEVIISHSNFIGVVNLSDQYLTSYSGLKKSME